jgi:cold shock CspA family protein
MSILSGETRLSHHQPSGFLGEREYLMPKGIIRRLVIDRRFGFIQRADGEDLFFRRIELRGVDFDSLREGQEVEFEVKQRFSGHPQAVQVRLAQPKTA